MPLSEAQKEEIAFQAAIDSRNKAELIRFLETTSNVAHKHEVRQILRDIEEDEIWQQVNKNSYAALDEFLEDYSHSPHAQDAQALIEKLRSELREPAQQASAPKAKPPRPAQPEPPDECAETARQQAEAARKQQEAEAQKAWEAQAKAHDDAWQRAVTQHSIDGYRQFLAEYPNGANTREARRLLKELERANRGQAAPWRRYAGYGGGVLAVLLAIWLLPKIFGLEETPANSDMTAGQDTTNQPPMDLDQARQDSAALSVLPEEETKDSPEKAAPEKSVAGTNTVKSKPALPQFTFDYPMVRVAGGTFMMGDANGEKDECPHTVRVGSFSIGRYEVSQAQWRAVMGSNPSKFQGCDNCPVEQVSWNEVQNFIKKLNQLAGENYRLPTEAEWEFAARGGNNSRGYYFAGNNDLGTVAWYGGNSSKKTHPVGTKAPNELGLYDMSGNVKEWCQDKYGPYPGCSSPENMRDSRVLRGSSWGYDHDYYFRPASRIRYYPNPRININGFRVARH